MAMFSGEQPAATNEALVEKPSEASGTAGTEFAAACLRGLRGRDWATKKGIKAAAFQPHKATINRRRREGKIPVGSEISINWEDSVDALELLRGDEVNAKYGVARLGLSGLEYAVTAPGFGHLLAWERAPLKDNVYHGNLIFLEQIEDHQTLRLQQLLALLATEVREQDE